MSIEESKVFFMIGESKVYTMICDNCGKRGLCFDNIDLLEEIAQEDGEWMKVNKEHYCPDCYEIDEYDDIQIKLI